MPQNGYISDETIQQLPTVEMETGKSVPRLDTCPKLGITEQPLSQLVSLPLLCIYLAWSQPGSTSTPIL